MALGGVVAAGVGAGAAVYLMPKLMPQPEAPTIDTAALKQEILSEVQSQNASLADELKAAAQTEAPVDLEALSQQASDAGAEAARQVIAELPEGGTAGAPQLQAAIEAQAQQIAALGEKLSALESAGGGAGSPALEQQVAALQAQVQKAAEEVQAQLDAVKTEARQMQEAAQSTTQRAEAVAAIASLQAALDKGVPTADAVQQLKAAGVAAPDAVKQDVPTLTALQDQFPEASRAALRAALKAQSPGESSGTLIGNFLRAQTGARSVVPREGDDPDAVLSRVGGAVQTGNIAGAVEQLSALPQAALEAPAMVSWAGGAKSYVAARAAVNELSGQSN